MSYYYKVGWCGYESSHSYTLVHSNEYTASEFRAFVLEAVVVGVRDFLETETYPLFLGHADDVVRLIGTALVKTRGFHALEYSASYLSGEFLDNNIIDVRTGKKGIQEPPHELVKALQDAGITEDVIDTHNLEHSYEGGI